MFTFAKMKAYVVHCRGAIRRMEDEDDESFNKRLKQQDKLIQELVDNTNAYNFIFDERVMYNESETKKHYQRCEVLLYLEGLRLRKALHIYHGEVPDGKLNASSALLSKMQKINRI